jgi:hypothetical protein
MKFFLVPVLLIAIFAAAALPLAASTAPSHKHHKVKRHKGVKHHV